MGIPGLYRWLVDRYPDTLCSVAEDRSRYVKGVPCTDTSKPNPNGVEFDNLYIDMNGVIHTCFHPEGLPAPQSYEDVFKFIFEYIDRVFSIVRPRKLLFLAVDGVAPRAKMNHQRIRRFRAAREAASKVCAVEEVEGIDKNTKSDKKLDSNVITPGTEFMVLLSCALKYYVYWRVNRDSGWRGIKVILSDSTVVGEGEDKIMSYIRSQRNLPGYDPNTRHCLHGLDADLIMLALATHEIHVSILREVITNGRIGNPKQMKDGKKRLYNARMRQLIIGLKFEFFNIWVLREYLERELLPNVGGADFDRLIDDFVFICFFVGNDFLPRLPSLDISQGAIESLLFVYQEEFVKMGYLTNAPEVNLKSMEHFLQALSSHENTIFMKRSQIFMEKRSKRKRKGFQDSYDQPGIVELQSITASKPNPDDIESTTSKVKIHKKNMKQKHYTRNFDCESHDIDKIKRDAVLKYTEGVCWIMHYYYQGVCSWQWFYPYHYAPLASDFCGLDKLEINFILGQPFKPLDQLLGVLPAASAQALPLFYRELMTNPSSPILDFYPKDAKIDKNGKKHAWQGVCKLPFIEEARLLSEIQKVEHTLTDEEKKRNRFGRDMLFVHCCHPLAKMIMDLPLSDPSSELQIQIRPDLSGGMNGFLFISDKPVCPCTIPSPFVDKPTVKLNFVKSVDYKSPSHAHIPKLPCGIIMPPRILRCQNSPCPPVSWTPSLSQSIVSESPTKKSQKKKKRKEDDKLDHCVAPEQDGNKDEATENIINGKSEAEKSTNHEICFNKGDGEHESLSGEPKKNKEKKKKSVNGAAAAGQMVEKQQNMGVEEHDEAQSEVPQGIKNVVSVEKPTIGIGSSNNQQDVALKHTKRGEEDNTMMNGGGAGDKVGFCDKKLTNKMESLAAAENLRNKRASDSSNVSGGEDNQRKEEKKRNLVVKISGKVEDENMNGFQVKANKEQECGVDDENEKKKRKGGDVVNESKASEKKPPPTTKSDISENMDDGGPKQGSKRKKRKRKLGGEHVIEPDSNNIEVREQETRYVDDGGGKQQRIKRGG